MDHKSPNKRVAFATRKHLIAALAAFVVISGPAGAQTSSNPSIAYTWSVFRELCGSFIANHDAFVQSPGSFRVDDWLWYMRTSEDIGHYAFHTQGANESPWLDAGIDIRPEGTQLHCEAIAFEPGLSDAESALSEVIRLVGDDPSLEVAFGSIEPIPGPGSVENLSNYTSTSHIVRIQGVFDRPATTVTANIEKEGYIYFGVSLVLPETK